MPVQQQMSSFAKKLGGRVAQANAEHADKPVDTGNRRLPGGIRDGVAKLSSMYTKTQDADNGMVPKGEIFFRASAIVVSPDSHDGEKVAGMVTQVLVPLCDVPAKGMRKARSFSENWFEFQNIFKLLGVPPCPETTATDPTGQRTEAYFFAAMKALTERSKANPVYVSFSTRGWTPPATPAQPRPEQMVFETWHGLAQFNGQVDPGKGVVDNLPPSTQPDRMTPPPSPNHVATPATQMETPDPADVVAVLVETAMNDPEGATDEGASAGAQLEEMAWAAGWTNEQTAGAADWAQVGDMALNPPTAAPASGPPPTSGSTVTVGSRWMFAKRSKAGERLKDAKGKEFPPQEVEVVTVDEKTATCTVKARRDGKDVTDLKTKKPVVVQFGWLEQAPPY